MVQSATAPKSLRQTISLLPSCVKSTGLATSSAASLPLNTVTVMVCVLDRLPAEALTCTM